MDRDTFKDFVAKALKEVVALAEEKAGRKLPNKLEFKWLGKDQPRVSENIADHITNRVFVDDDHIYPCVDLGVADILNEETLLLVASVAGYPPSSFGKNWTGREGPFVYIVGMPLLNRVAGRNDSWTPEDGGIGFITPGDFWKKKQ